MAWTKVGLLVPAPPPLRWSASHAALPVVEPLGGDRIRLYFSSRDPLGRSQIGRCELDLGDGRPEFDPTPVLTSGPLGSFDDSGVTASCLVGQGARRYLYYTGWTRGVTVPFYYFVGCAVSENGGRTFEKASPAPILERDRIDPFLTASPWVLVEAGLWRMWYVSGTGWTMDQGAPRHHYHIKYAESADGIRWQRSGHVCIDYQDPSEYAISRPCVIRDADRYRMWYAYRGRSYRIAYAESDDGLSWTRRGDVLGPSESGWDAEMVEYPVVFDIGGIRRMLYNGNGYGRTGIGVAQLDEGDGPKSTRER